MEFDLQADLQRFGRMAFVRAADCTELIRRFHRLKRRARAHPDYELIEKIYAWVFVPLTLWPIDVRGLAMQLLDGTAAGSQLDAQTRLLVSFLPPPPPESIWGPIAEYEHAVKEGNYEQLIHAQHKFDLMEQELSDNVEFRKDWQRIKDQFPVDKYRNERGVIRRRLVQERNFRPRDWKFSSETEMQRFQNVFDAFCHKWDLYGMEKVRLGSSRVHSHAPGKLQRSTGRDRPLLLKLTVNLTAFGTMIEVPKYWSFDPKRDLNWREITRLHRARGVTKQGPKLSVEKKARESEAAKARDLWQQATRAGLRGDKRNEWVMKRLAWDMRTNPSRLRRLVMAD